ncbi:hypothetical protein SAY86_027790 [Trapa natans]|uniref:Exostosin GT47 domain-containing protein n=1 Tax=Trapa natans TaxID=22666 RepID=A0AAN7QMS4_TRANT|nr:hypothetical protein SAY86_027790 [Trapa natans]
MRRPLIVTLIVTRDLFRLCVGKRVTWRKFIIFGIIMTMCGMVLPHLLYLSCSNSWRLLSQPIIASSYYSLNSSMHISGAQNRARLEQTLSVPAAPAGSVNFSTQTAQSVSTEKRQASKRRQRKRHSQVIPKVLSPPPPPPRRRSIPNHLQKSLWSLQPNEALAFAKRELENASAVIDDPDLYAPVFRNISIFKRSYELMEMILKVYIYPDGKRPIFHKPHLFGIYASEGWFMKQMEQNRQFVTRDPEKAHLFYLPYSARQLKLAIYVPGSHDIRPLSIYLRDHMNYLAAKYPFWNRTHGSDHFLVACHDWGPYALTAHEELTLNTIKALCNADISEGIFKAGKDVSLPETIIRNPNKPMRFVGGLMVSQRPILAFFAGHMHGKVRPILLKYWKNKDDDMRIYGPLPKRVSKKMSYVQHMKSSKYCLCPTGYEVNSPRVVEAIYYECVPVIIADNFVPPLNQVFDWSSFSVTVLEKDIPKLKEILTAIPLRRYLKMQTNVKKVQKHFLWNLRPVKYDLFHMILHSIWFSRLNQIEVSLQQ